MKSEEIKINAIDRWALSVLFAIKSCELDKEMNQNR